MNRDWLQKVQTFFFVLAATLHIRQVVIEWRFLAGAIESGFLTSPFFMQLQLSFIIFFLLWAFASLNKNRLKMILGSVSFAGVLTNYVLWLLYSNRQLKALSLESWSPARHTEFLSKYQFGLIGAKWWDIAILLLCVGVFVCQVLSVTHGSRPRHTDRNTR
jgi:hypothetical protein